MWYYNLITSYSNGGWVTAGWQYFPITHNVCYFSSFLHTLISLPLSSRLSVPHVYPLYGLTLVTSTEFALIERLVHLSMLPHQMHERFRYIMSFELLIMPTETKKQMHGDGSAVYSLVWCCSEKIACRALLQVGKVASTPEEADQYQQRHMSPCSYY